MREDSSTQETTQRTEAASAPVQQKGEEKESGGKRGGAGVALLTTPQMIRVLEQRYGEELRKYFDATDPMDQAVGWKMIGDELKSKYGKVVTSKQLYDTCNAKKQTFRGRLLKAKQSGEEALMPWPFHEVLTRLLSSSHPVNRYHSQQSKLPPTSSSSQIPLPPPPNKKQKMSKSDAHITSLISSALITMANNNKAALQMNNRFLFKMLSLSMGGSGSALQNRTFESIMGEIEEEEKAQADALAAAQIALEGDAEGQAFVEGQLETQQWRRE